MRNDLCGCLALRQNLMSALGAWALQSSCVETETVLSASLPRESPTMIDANSHCGASLWNETAFNGFPAKPSSHNGAKPCSSGVESALEYCSVSLHLCIEYSAALRWLLWLTLRFAI